MTNSARTNILHRLRHFRDSHPATEGHAQPGNKGSTGTPVNTGVYESLSAADNKTLFTNSLFTSSLFISSLEAAHAEVVSTHRDTWLTALNQHLQQNRITNLLYAPRIVAPRSAGRTATDSADSARTALEGQTFASTELIPFAEPVEAFKNDLFNKVAASISFAEAGIAQTGTLLLKTGPNEPRTLSLVPPVHYIWLAANSMYNTLADAFTDSRITIDLSTNLLLISGPSKTADIQQTLAYGAHGPKRLIVFLVSD